MTKPIIFNTEMIRAILDGRKSQTRRVIKPQPYNIGYDHYPDMPCVFISGKKGSYIKLCPYGKIGETLWVRETFADCEGMGIVSEDGEPADIIYKADDCWEEEWDGAWTPSIYMPRGLSRITLEITNFMVERVQDISEGDVFKEGIERNPDTEGYPFSAFAELWDKINLKRGYGNDVNPFVWVVEFKVV